MRIWPQARSAGIELSDPAPDSLADPADQPALSREDRKSTRLNSSHSQISYAVFCLKKKKMLFVYTLLVQLSTRFFARADGVLASSVARTSDVAGRAVTRPMSSMPTEFLARCLRRW